MIHIHGYKDSLLGWIWILKDLMDIRPLRTLLSSALSRADEDSPDVPLDDVDAVPWHIWCI
jgi:hypothetical protein